MSSPNHATSDFHEPRSDESSGPFDASSLQEMVATQLKAREKSTRYFKGLQIGLPWTLVVMLAGAGGWNLWIHQHDDEKDNVARDTLINANGAQVKLLVESLSAFKLEVNDNFNKLDRKVDRLSDSLQFRK
jgi:hypothetical protein